MNYKNIIQIIEKYKGYSIGEIKSNNIKYMINLNLLKNKEFIKWVHGPIIEVSLLNSSVATKLKPYAIIESEWGVKLKGGKGKISWTGPLCQIATEEILNNLGYKNVRLARRIKSTTSKKGYQPDLECDDFVWEIKGRTWTTTGTGGEKILGTPLKYSEIPKLYGKPLKIVCVGYQEWEAKNGFACGNLINPKERGTEELQKILILFNKLDIEYIGFTDLLEKLNKKSKLNSGLNLKNK